MSSIPSTYVQGSELIRSFSLAALERHAKSGSTPQDCSRRDWSPRWGKEKTTSRPAEYAGALLATWFSELRMEPRTSAVGKFHVFQVCLSYLSGRRVSIPTTPYPQQPSIGLPLAISCLAFPCLALPMPCQCLANAWLGASSSRSKHIFSWDAENTLTQVSSSAGEYEVLWWERSLTG
jgi:hypothetical protein